MTHGSLFSGIGGFDLAAEWVGWQNIFHCEWNEFGQKVLKYHFPQSISYNDITKTDFTIHRGQIDILTGGFPCQPYSLAGKRKGKEDERHLWPEMLRAIREIQPSWVVGENVRGLTNWNGGMVFDEVQSEMEIEGYKVTSFLLPACAVNAPHRRDRIWFVAYSKNNGCDKRRERINKREKYKFCYGNKIRNIITSNGEKSNASNTNCNGLNKCDCNNEINTSKGGINAFSNINESNGNGIVADTLPIRLQQCENGEEVGGRQGEMGRERSESTNAIETNGEIQNATDTNGIGLWRQSNGAGESRFLGKDSKGSNWENFPTQSPICGGDDGLPKELDSITFSKWRNESIKAYGNAIVPQVAYQIFKAIEEYTNKIYNK